MNPAAPPGYAIEPQSHNTGGSSASGDSQLPAYSGRQPPALAAPRVTQEQRPPTEHVYELTNTRGAWATLKVYSSARKAKQMPTFLEGDPIFGTFALQLDRDDHILAIKFEVKGQIMTGGRFPNQTTFVHECKTLWSKEMGDPRRPDTSSTGRYSGKLLGSYTFPYSITLPSTVTLPLAGSSSTSSAHGASGPFRLPETFLERQSQVTIQYDVEINIIRSRFRVDSKLSAMIAYVPAIRPPEPSLLRRLAYQENIPILGPEADPDGWQQMKPFTTRGTVFKKRQVDLHCKLFLAKPLCYTRGTALPCILHISSTDLQALDLLSSPPAIAVYLRRRVAGYNAIAATTYLPQAPPPPSRKGFNGSASLDHHEGSVGTAVWWPSSEGAPEDIPDSSDPSPGVGNLVATRKLNGEIHLPQTLKPSCLMGDFSIEYTVTVLPFNAVAFTSAIDGPLLEQTVEIATLFAKGPRPRAYAPPIYDQGDRIIGDNLSIPPHTHFL